MTRRTAIAACAAAFTPRHMPYHWWECRDEFEEAEWWDSKSQAELDRYFEAHPVAPVTPAWYERAITLDRESQ